MGVTSKFSLGGGDCVRHSSPGKCHGFASACLPFLFQAVEIDGEPYWDGGYTSDAAFGISA